MARVWMADELLEMARSFQAACIITAAADLDVFTVLAGNPASARAVAAEIGAEPRALAVLLDALVACDLLRKEGDHYAVPPDLAEFLTADSPTNVLPAVRHQGNCLRRWVQLARVVKTGEPASTEPSIRGGDADCESFIGAMNNFTAPVAPQIIEKLLPLKFERLLDIGGASGTWTIAFLLAVPEATAVLFDLPEVIPLAEKRLARAGLADRVTLVAGDYNTDTLAGGADFAWLSAITHQNAREQNCALYAKIHRALVPGGQLVIRDIVMEANHTAPTSGALFAVNMLVNTEGGGTFSFEEFAEDLKAGGFAEIELLHQDATMNSLIRARKG